MQNKNAKSRSANEKYKMSFAFFRMLKKKYQQFFFSVLYFFVPHWTVSVQTFENSKSVFFSIIDLFDRFRRKHKIHVNNTFSYFSLRLKTRQNRDIISELREIIVNFLRRNNSCIHRDQRTINYFANVLFRADKIYIRLYY